MMCMSDTVLSFVRYAYQLLYSPSLCRCRYYPEKQMTFTAGVSLSLAYGRSKQGIVRRTKKDKQAIDPNTNNNMNQPHLTMDIVFR